VCIRVYPRFLSWNPRNTLRKRWLNHEWTQTNTNELRKAWLSLVFLCVHSWLKRCFSVSLKDQDIGDFHAVTHQVNEGTSVTTCPFVSFVCFVGITAAFRFKGFAPDGSVRGDACRTAVGQLCSPLMTTSRNSRARFANASTPAGSAGRGSSGAKIFSQHNGIFRPVKATGASSL